MDVFFKNKIIELLTQELLRQVTLKDLNFHGDVFTKVTDADKKSQLLKYDSKVAEIKYYMFDRYEEAREFRDGDK